MSEVALYSRLVQGSLAVSSAVTAKPWSGYNDPVRGEAFREIVSRLRGTTGVTLGPHRLREIQQLVDREYDRISREQSTSSRSVWSAIGDMIVPSAHADGGLTLLIVAAVLALLAVGCSDQGFVSLAQPELSIAPIDPANFPISSVASCYVEGDAEVDGYKVTEIGAIDLAGSVDWGGAVIAGTWSIYDDGGANQRSADAAFETDIEESNLHSASVLAVPAADPGRSQKVALAVTVTGSENSNGASSTKEGSASVCVYTDKIPEIFELTSPIDGNTYGNAETIAFAASVADLEDNPEDLEIT